MLELKTASVTLLPLRALLPPPSPSPSPSPSPFPPNSFLLPHPTPSPHSPSSRGELILNPTRPFEPGNWDTWMVLDPWDKV